MPSKENIPVGYLDRKEAARFLGLSGSMFDRIASSEFKHSRIRVGNGNAFYYSETDLQTYRDFREKRKQAGEEGLTWKQLVDRNEELAHWNDIGKELVRIFQWLLTSNFAAGEEVEFSAAHMEKMMPEKYEQARQILSNLGLDLEELKQRLGCPERSTTNTALGNHTTFR